MAHHSHHRERELRNERFGLSVTAGYSLEVVTARLWQHTWADLLGYFIRSKVVTMTRDDANREIIVDWRGATSDTIGQYMAQLKNTPEFGGNFCVFDISEEDRTGASQKEMEVHRQRRLEVQRAEETLEQLKLLQPSVCSIGGIFGAAELGNNPVMDAFIKGYPKPLYDPKTGKSVPNPDRRAVPENKHQLRAQQQLAHRPTRLQYSHENCVPAGDPLDDLRLAAPHLLAQAYDESSILKGACFDLRDEFGKTPLHFAAAAGKTATVRLLLDNGADPNALDREGHTSLHMAALQGQTESLALLMKRGGRVDITSVGGRTILHCACQNGHADLIEQLLFSDELIKYRAYELMERKTFEERETVLHALCRSPKGTPEEAKRSNLTAKHLLKAWFQLCNKQSPLLVDQQDALGFTALHVCATMGHEELLRYICSFGAKPNLPCRTGDLPVHIATRAGSIPMVTILISSGSNLSHENNEGQTPLHIAARIGIFPIFKMCIHSFPQSGGISPFSYLDSFGDSAIHIAARQCRPDTNGETPFRELVRYAVNNRADPLMRNSGGNTPLMCACMGGDTKTVTFLLEYTVEDTGLSKAHHARNDCGETSVTLAARHGNTEVVRELLKLAADIHARSRTGEGCVAEAAERGHADTVRALIEMRADPLVTDVLGRQALHWAAKRGHADVVRVLVQECWVSPDLQDRYGATPLLLASELGMEDAVRTLLHSGAEPRFANKHGATALSLAKSAAVEEACLLWEARCEGRPSLHVARFLRLGQDVMQGIVEGVGRIVYEQTLQEEADQERLAAASAVREAEEAELTSQRYSRRGTLSPGKASTAKMKTPSSLPVPSPDLLGSNTISRADLSETSTISSINDFSPDLLGSNTISRAGEKSLIDGYIISPSARPTIFASAASPVAHEYHEPAGLPLIDAGDETRADKDIASVASVGQFRTPASGTLLSVPGRSEVGLSFSASQRRARPGTSRHVPRRPMSVIDDFCEQQDDTENLSPFVRWRPGTSHLPSMPLSEPDESSAERTARETFSSSPTGRISARRQSIAVRWMSISPEGESNIPMSAASSRTRSISQDIISSNKRPVFGRTGSLLKTARSQSIGGSVRFGAEKHEMLVTSNVSEEGHPTKRPFTTYTTLIDGEPQTSKWMLPTRPNTTEPYKRQSPRLRPRNPEAFYGTGSALDLQMLKVEWAANSPYALMFGRASTATTASEGFSETQGRFGAYRSIDQSWSQLESSSFWRQEHRPQRLDRLQRAHGRMLRAMRPTTSPDKPRAIVNERREPGEVSWLPPLHGTSRFKRPSTEDPSLISANTIWWFDPLEATPDITADGKWVKMTERSRHTAAEVERLTFQKERRRAEELQRLIMLDEPEKEEEEYASTRGSATPSTTDASQTGSAIKASAAARALMNAQGYLQRVRS